MRAAVSRQDIDWIIESILSLRRRRLRRPRHPADDPVVHRDGRAGGGTVIERPVFFGRGACSGSDRACGRRRGRRVRRCSTPAARIRQRGVRCHGSRLNLPQRRESPPRGPGRQWVSWPPLGAPVSAVSAWISVGGGEPWSDTGRAVELPADGLGDVAEGVHMMAPTIRGSGPARAVLGRVPLPLAAPSTPTSCVWPCSTAPPPSALVQQPGSMGDLIAGPDGNWSAAATTTGRGPPQSVGSSVHSGTARPQADLAAHPDRVVGGNTCPCQPPRRRTATGGRQRVLAVRDPRSGRVARYRSGRRHELQRVARNGVFSMALVPNLDTTSTWPAVGARR